MQNQVLCVQLSAVTDGKAANFGESNPKEDCNYDLNCAYTEKRDINHHETCHLLLWWWPIIVSPSLRIQKSDCVKYSERKSQTCNYKVEKPNVVLLLLRLFIFLEDNLDGAWDSVVLAGENPVALGEAEHRSRAEDAKANHPWPVDSSMTIIRKRFAVREKWSNVCQAAGQQQPWDCQDELVTGAKSYFYQNGAKCEHEDAWSQIC